MSIGPTLTMSSFTISEPNKFVCLKLLEGINKMVQSLIFGDKGKVPGDVLHVICLHPAKCYVPSG